jgi:Cu/Ag efflux protein CusF
MIKPLLFTFAVALLAGNAFVTTAAAPGDTIQTTPSSFEAAAHKATTVATIDEDRAMAELLKG